MQGTVYRGKTEKGKLVSGELRFKNGDTYTGTFKDGHFKGRGVYRSHEGWTFKGVFHRGVAQGQGKLLKDGKVIQSGNYDKGVYARFLLSACDADLATFDLDDLSCFTLHASGRKRLYYRSFSSNRSSIRLCD